MNYEEALKALDKLSLFEIRMISMKIDKLLLDGGVKLNQARDRKSVV